MGGGSIVLNTISCKGVKYFTLFQKPSVYSVVYITGGGVGRQPKQQKHKTSPDHEGGENPEWDQTMEFDLDHGDLHDIFLEFTIKAQGNLLLGDKLIGKSRVLMVDLTEGQPSGVVRHVSYRVQSSDGKPNGVLSFSYKLTLPDLEIPLPPPLDPIILSVRPNSSLSLPASVHRESIYPPLPLPAPVHRESLYPPLPLPEEAPPDIFLHNYQPSLLDPTNSYTPPPPLSPAAVGYYHPSDSDRALYPDPSYTPSHAYANWEYYHPPSAAIPPPRPMPTPSLSFGTYYPQSAPGYAYAPPQDSCGYCNSYMKKSKYEEELNSKASSSIEQARGYIGDTDRNIQTAWDYAQSSHMHIAWASPGRLNCEETRGPPPHQHI